MGEEPFELPPPKAIKAEAASGGGQLVVDLDGFEGPIDILLTLAREQKVDLARISILQLADQYLAFITEAGRLRLELAADYLVMAAWLAYLKSRLLLPEVEPDDEEPSGEDLAAALAFQLQRLEAMRKAAIALTDRPQLGRDSFQRGAPEGLAPVRRTVYQASLIDLLRAYGAFKRRTTAEILEIRPTELFSMDDALKRLTNLLGLSVDWRSLSSFLPPNLRTPLIRRSAIAASFAASLELARSGRIELRQDAPFGPIYLRGVRS